MNTRVEPERRWREDAYAEIRDYAAIGNGRAVALVAREGAIDWLCMPDIDSPSVFAGVLDAERGGSFERRIERRFGISIATSGASGLAAQGWNADEWTTDPGAIGGHIEVHRGESALIALNLSHKEPLVFSTREQVETRIDATARAWAPSGQQATFTALHGAVLRSALALKLHVYAPSGAPAAAATTSVAPRRRWSA